jgi:hypothetical protein
MIARTGVPTSAVSFIVSCSISLCLPAALCSATGSVAIIEYSFPNKNKMGLKWAKLILNH